MSIIDFIILFIMGMGSIWGAYNGFISSAVSFISYIFTWLISLIFYPLISKLIVATFPNILNTISVYVEGASKIPIIEDRSLPISSLTEDKLANIVEQMRLPHPFGKELLTNFDKVGEGIVTLGEYVDYTLSAVIINIASFLLLFFLIKLVITLVLSIGKVLADVPVLKRHELLVGAGFGLLGSIFIIYFFFALMPVFMTIAPPDLFVEIIGESRLGNFFYKTNIFTNFIRKTI